MSITVQNVSKQFGEFHALKDVSLEVSSGELIALLGPSGCGKTTLLRIIAGLESPNTGSIIFAGEDVTNINVRDRQVGFVFQHYALFRHMTVFDNVAFGLEVKPRKFRPSRNEIRKKVHSLLELVQLDWLADRYPWQLSGGQRQRIALARALAVEPKVLLLDEPFGALDAKVRKELRRWLRRLHDELNVTSLFVTHDQEEALEVSDRVVLMNNGKIEQVGTPQHVWENPANPFVYGFLGDVNRFDGESKDGLISFNGTTINGSDHEKIPDGNATAYIRPHDFDVIRYSPGLSGITARLDRSTIFGPIAHLEMSTVEANHEKSRYLDIQISTEKFNNLALKDGEQLVLQPLKAKVFPNAASHHN